MGVSLIPVRRLTGGALLCAALAAAAPMGTAPAAAKPASQRAVPAVQPTASRCPAAQPSRRGVARPRRARICARPRIVPFGRVDWGRVMRAVPRPAGATSPAGEPAAPAPAAPAGEVDGGATVPPPIYSNPRALQVRGFEFGLRLSKASVLAGEVRVEFNLIGAEDPHNLILARADGRDVMTFHEQPAGEVLARMLPLTAGRWRLFCSLPGHQEAGMEADLEVVPG
jgi:uncharacterized cupredoxin-like copper-binding protein